jgi:hypothetical protein
MRAKPIPAIPSPSAVSGRAGVEAGLHLLLDAFSHAFHDHKPLGECAVPLKILLHTGMPLEELQRLVTAGLVSCCAEKDYPAEWPRLAEVEKEVGRSPSGGYILTAAGMAAVFQMLPEQEAMAATLASGPAHGLVLVALA